jgi:hypothetical protein
MPLSAVNYMHNVYNVCLPNDSQLDFRIEWERSTWQERRVKNLITEYALERVSENYMLNVI